MVFLKIQTRKRVGIFVLLLLGTFLDGYQKIMLYFGILPYNEYNECVKKKMAKIRYVMLLLLFFKFCCGAFS